MNPQTIIAIICVSLFTASVSVSAHFFPNASSIPPSLIPNVSSGAWQSFLKLAGCRAGEKVDGLSKLKKYFQYFGYIDFTSANFTDDFDDALQSAIKTYQLNFNLEPTGELDANTINQIMKPRCGNADVVNGTTTMHSGNNKTTTSSSHVHSVAHYSFFPNSPRWGKTHLTYGFLPGNQLTDPVKLVFTRAFDRWAAVIPLTFSLSTTYGSADIKIAFFAGDHGDGEPFDGGLGTLAHAFSPPAGLFHLDGEETWVTDGDFSGVSVFSAVDLESVAVHEIGHLLGLGHSSVEGAIMYPSISSGTRKVELASDDVEGIQVLYGSNPDYNGSVTTPSQQRETGNSGSHLFGPMWGLSLLSAVGLVFLI